MEGKESRSVGRGWGNASVLLQMISSSPDCRECSRLTTEFDKHKHPFSSDLDPGSVSQHCLQSERSQTFPSIWDQYQLFDLTRFV